MPDAPGPTTFTAIQLNLEPGENLRTFLRGFATADRFMGAHLWESAKWRARDWELKFMAGEIAAYYEVVVVWGTDALNTRQVFTFAQIEALVNATVS